MLMKQSGTIHSGHTVGRSKENKVVRWADKPGKRTGDWHSAFLNHTL